MKNIRPSEESITFGDGIKSFITGVGTLNVPGLLDLKDILMVQGLHANLISINQMCDQNWNARFNKIQCCVLDNN